MTTTALSFQNSIYSTVNQDPSAKATRLYEQATKSDMIALVKSLFRKKENGSLLSLTAVTNGENHTPKSAGLQMIPLSKIRGSNSDARAQDFDARFRPLKPQLKTRWLNVAKTFLAGKSLPAVDLVQYKNDYFVMDGHHRVSVAYAMGRDDIKANVTVWAA